VSEASQIESLSQAFTLHFPRSLTLSLARIQTEESIRHKDNRHVA